MMSRFKNLAAFVVITALASYSSASMIDARVNLGTNSANPIGEDFFGAGSGFTQGDTSHTNTLTFDDGDVSVSLTITAEAFDAGGAPAGLMVNSQAAGVEIGVNDDQVDPGETIKFTYDAIDFNVIGALPPGLSLDPDSLVVELGSIRFAAFDAGIDTYTFAGTGAANSVGDDTLTLDFMPDAKVQVGDMYSITGDSGAFRILYLSHGASYSTIPEPTAASLLLAAAAGLTARGRRR